MSVCPAEAPADCTLCPRLVSFRVSNRSAEPSWHNGPVPSFGREDAAQVRLLIVGLAPGLRGANRTGRPFTGDYAGDLLYETLLSYGFARGRYDARPDDGLTLVDCMITNAVRCVPPENKPTPAEIATCRRYLSERLATLPQLAAIVALGRIAHDSTLAALAAAQGRLPLCARRPARDASRPHAVRQLPLFSLQHQHRQADAGNVRVGVRSRQEPSRPTPVDARRYTPGLGRVAIVHQARNDRRTLASCLLPLSDFRP